MRTRHRKLSTGFTLVELLVTCVCCSILAAVALPMVNKARDDRKAVECSNQLRQIAIASHNYHDSHKRLPSATVGVKDAAVKGEWMDVDGVNSFRNQQNVSSLALIAPFMGLNNIYERADPFLFNVHRNLTDYVDANGDQVYPDFRMVVGVDAMVGAEVERLLCPEDNLSEAELEKVVIVTQPLLTAEDENDMGLKFATEGDPWDKYGLTNYLANGGPGGGHSARNSELRERARFVGPMKSRTKTTLETIMDGTSNTMMYGENLGGIAGGERTVAHTWALGGFARGRGEIPWAKDVDPDNENRRILGDANESSLYGYGSKHEAGVNFARCDGSVACYSREIDAETFYAMLGAGDGVVVDDEPFDEMRKIEQRKNREETAALLEAAKDNPVILALEKDAAMNDRDREQILQRYIRFLSQRKELVDELKKLAKGNELLEAMVADPYLTWEEKEQFLNGYLRRTSEGGARKPPVPRKAVPEPMIDKATEIDR